MERSVLSILVGLWLITCFAAAEKAAYVPALYVFGDSLADAGNNNYIRGCTIRADFVPYGVSYSHHPTGRFTNGRTAVDFLAAHLGLPFPPPYLKPKANFGSGINFASGGSGLLDVTGADQNVMSMGQQVVLFEKYSDYLTEAARVKLGNSLFAIMIGSNDISSYIFKYMFTYTREKFANLLLGKLDEYVTRLYNRGARKFLLLNIPPVGCIPTARLLGYSFYHGECVELVNRVVQAYNTAFSSFATQLNEKLSGTIIHQFNTYDVVMDIIQNGEDYGFNTESACCGWGFYNTVVGCGKTNPPDSHCSNTSAYVFWDGFHGTEKVYGMISEQIWSGSTSVMHPFNLSTLVLGETHLITTGVQNLSEM